MTLFWHALTIVLLFEAFKSLLRLGWWIFFNGTFSVRSYVMTLLRLRRARRAVDRRKV